MDEFRYEEALLAAPDGLRLRARLWIPRKKAEAVFVICHGFGEYSLRYQRFVESLPEFPFVFASFDLRGHGESEGERVYVGKFSEYTRDLLDFFIFLKERFPEAGEKTYLFGHSMGSLVASQFVLQKLGPVKALFLSSPAFSVRFWFPFAENLSVALGGLIPHWIFENPIRPVFLTHDPREADHYKWDPLIQRRITLALTREMVLAGREVLARAAEIQTPTYVLLAGQDRIVHKRSVYRFFQKLGSARKRFYELEGFYHEIFNEVDRARSFEKLKEFIREAEELK